jgi:hypothetical protein
VRDVDIFAAALNLDASWRIVSVDLSIEASQVVIQIEHEGCRRRFKNAEVRRAKNTEPRRSNNTEFLCLKGILH